MVKTKTYTPQELARYELYKFHWLMQHGYTVNDLVESVLKYRKEYAEEMTDDGLAELDNNIFEIWENERGFGSEAWSSMDEFLELDDKDLEEYTTLYQDHKHFLDKISARISFSKSLEKSSKS